tara:strand:- start:1411 stop:2136 length:726 start_codon:yes stop_codon:yes gene_type:complete
MASSPNKKNNYPKNIGIIMDGNGRWAKANKLKVTQGHEKGVGVVRDIVKECAAKDIESLTIYAFSSENWSRPKSEINGIKKLIVKAITDQVPELIEQSVMLNFFGDVHSFGYEIQEKTRKAEDHTAQENPTLRLNVALGYGGRKDIVNACKELAIGYEAGQFNFDDIDEDMIAKTSQVPDDNIDLIIRTGGDKRLSNFLLFQAAYAEIMFIDKLWPDFTKDDFINCLDDFKKVSRRFGKRA